MAKNPFGGGKFQVKSHPVTPLKAPSGGGGNLLLQSMLLQQRGNVGQQPEEVPLVRRNPYTNQRYGNPQAQQYQAQQELMNDSTRKAGSAAIAINVVNHFEDRYRKVFGDILGKGGVDGQKAMLQKYVDGYVKKGNPDYVALAVDMPNIVSQLQRAVSETGNIATAKEVREGRALPKLIPSATDPANLFMPDDPMSALAKFEGLRSMMQSTFDVYKQQAMSGQPSIPTAQPESQQSGESIDTKRQRLRDRYLGMKNA